MFFVIKILRKIVQILQTDISPDQLAYGFAMGLFLGLVPGILFKSFFFVLVMILRVNVGTAFMGSALFAILGFAIAPLSDSLGYFVLNLDFLASFWTSLYNTPIVPFSKFNNTIVMGNIVLSIILFIPVSIGVKKFIPYYRRRWRDKVAQLKIVKILTAGKISAMIFE
ncbi:MAG: TIGR03546 family protein [Elusimicrobiota bacterium]|jgi:uncharacterized protein (TIGR03546 family)|nr:TIGR03546 family protein [Elusimicrobiota bacterium]